MLLKWLGKFVKYRLKLANFHPKDEQKFTIFSKSFLGPSLSALTKFHLVSFHK
jgi:hypothetical protein